MDLSQAVAAGAAAGAAVAGGGRKRARTASRSRSRSRGAGGSRPSASITSTIARIGQYIAPICTTELKYVENYNMASATGYKEQIFRANSLFDFDYTLSGHQPLGFDQLASLYEKYRVKRLRGNFRFCFSDNTDYIGAVMVIYFNTSDTALTTWQDAAEQPGAKIAFTRWQTPAASISIDQDMAQILGKKKGDYNDDDNCSAAVSANPSQVVYMHVMCGGIYPYTSFAGRLIGSTVQSCQFFDVAKVAQS